MAKKISGREVIWGVPSGVIAGAHTVTTSGILQSFSIQPGGSEEIINDEDGDPVTRIDHGTVNKISFEVVCEPDTTLPLKGDEVTGLGELEGIDFSTGRVFVDDPQVTLTNAAAKKLTVSATHYPLMPANSL
jgi:hypothetical protein